MNLNHLGIREAPSKSTVAYQNRHRSSNVFKEIYYACLEHIGQHTCLAIRTDAIICATEETCFFDRLAGS
ncbi:MAG: hypothetical protein IKO62_00825, partial [Bacteroidales bacterium]|nr:hypothetical protein [Bacteroidales bacterium]